MVEPGEQPDGRDETKAARVPETKTFASGRYVVRRLLGEGAQKTVYLVHDQELDRDCALSLIRVDLLNPDDLTRVRREAQMMAGLGAQPHIVTVFDLGEDDDKPYIVCEYVPGGDLRQELREARGPLPLHRAVALAKDLCRALSVAHEQGIVHRDLKPANIWLTKQGAAKLGDFGIAQAVDRSRLTMTGAVMGTAAYMPPEQARGGEVTARSDLYSLGCVLYELLTGRPPFVADNPMAVVSQHVYGQPSLPSKDNPAIPEALERLVLRLLAKAPESRPASAEEVLAELERIEAALPETATLRPARGLARLWARPAYRVLVAAVLLGAVGGGAVAAALVMSGGGEGVISYQEITYRYGLPLETPQPTATPGVSPGISGDCVTEDLHIPGPSEDRPIVSGIAGDISGIEIATGGEVVLFAATECQTGFQTLVSVLVDQDGNELHITDAGPISLTLSPDMQTGFLTTTTVETVRGGTGIYEGATGTGICTGQIVVPASTTPEYPGPAGQITGGGECTLHVTTDPEARARTPLIVVVARSPTQVAIFGSPVDLPSTVEVVVSYWNGGDQPLTGLSLRLPAPEGTEIVTAARLEEEQTASAGERVWALPDLPPQGEVQLFPFQLQFLSAERGSVPLVVEIDGEGFAEPVRSEPVTIEVVR